MRNSFISRRDLLRGSSALAGYPALRAFAQGAPAAKDAPATHNWMLVGGATPFLSHLPMFDRLNDAGTDYATPHRYQVIMQVTFFSGSSDVTGTYFAERQAHPGVKMFTVSPTNPFVLSDVAEQPSFSFDATVFRGHLERGGQPIPKLNNITVKVVNAIHLHKFDPAAPAPAALEYFLFGRGKERFLAHSIVKPPDFDQLLSVQVTGVDASDDDLSHGMRIQLPDRKNTAADRVHEKQAVTGQLPSGARIDIQALREFYFEEGELLMPATFRPTKEEIKAGFST